MTEPKTLAEKLDACRTGADFGAVLQALFGALEEAMEAEDDPPPYCNRCGIPHTGKCNR